MSGTVIEKNKQKLTQTFSLSSLGTIFVQTGQKGKTEYGLKEIWIDTYFFKSYLLSTPKTLS